MLRVCFALLLLLGCGDDDAPAPDDAGPFDTDAGAGVDAGPATCVVLRDSVPVTGGVTDLAFGDDALFVGSPTTLYVIAPEDLSVREASVPVVQIVPASGAVVVHDGTQLRLFDVEETPTERATIDVSGEATAAAFGDALFVYRHPLGARINTFEAHRITSLTEVSPLASVDVTGGTPARMATDGELAFVADRESADGDSLLVLDVSDPATPSELQNATVEELTAVSHLAIRGDRGYLGAATRLRTFDLATLEELDALPGGELVAVRDTQVLTMSDTSLFVHDVEASTTREEDALPEATSLAWGDGVLALGDETSVRIYDVCF